jgi:hypothetical protein
MKKKESCIERIRSMKKKKKKKKKQKKKSDSQCKSPRRKVHMSLQSGTKSCITPVTIATWLDSP